MFEIKVFDCADYENRLAYNHELMVLVANEFIVEATHLYEVFQTSMASKDWESISLITQKLRGASLEVSGNRFCQLINELELLLKADEKNIPPMFVLDLENELNNLISALKQEVLI